MFYVAVIMIIKSLAGLAALKVQASLLLPSNFAVLSQFMTITGLVTNISNATIATGMTVLLSRAGATSNVGQLIRSGQVFSIGLSLIVSICCLIFFFLGTDLFSISPLPRYLFLILAVAPWLITQSSIVQARLTSSYQLNMFTRLSNGSVIAVAILIIVLTFYFGLTGSAIAAAIGPILAAGVLIMFGAMTRLERNPHLPSGSRIYDILELLRFSSAMLVAICAVPLSQIVVRGSMVSGGGVEQAGYWSAAVRLSDVYMQFFGLLLTFYILPKISSQKSFVDSKRLFVSYLGRLSLLAIGALTIVFVLREFVVTLALAPEFRPVISLLETQLLGDFFRIVLSFFFWFAYGQNLRMLAAIEEVLQACLFYIFFSVLWDHNDAQGVVVAHLFASVANTIIVGGCLLFVLSRRS
jgi:O-antigen/teichoic acid export membrane protein